MRKIKNFRIKLKTEMKEILLISCLIFPTIAVNIDCIFGTVSWAVVGNLYTCTVRSSQIIANESYITGFTGTHVSGSTNLNVRGFYFNYNCHHIKKVPTNIHQFFPNLIVQLQKFASIFLN